MKEENATSKNPIYKVIKKINNASDLDRLYKTGEYGITSLEAVNGSFNFNLEIKPSSANGHVMQRQTPSDVLDVINYTRVLININVWSEWMPYHRQGLIGKSSYQSYLDTTTNNPILTEAQWANLDGITATMLSNTIGFEIRDDLNLWMTMPDDYTGVEFEISNGNLMAIN